MIPSCVLATPAAAISWLPPADPSPEAAAAWWQAIGVIVSLFFSAWVLWRQRRDRVEDRDGESRRAPERITGWAERPKQERDPSTGLYRYWRVTGTVVNRSETEVWDVQVRLLDQDGRPIPTPTLLKAVLASNAEWQVWWTAGHRFKPHHPGGAEQDASPLPVPWAITDPAARLRLEVTFTDSTGQRWRRETSRLEKADRSPGPTAMPRDNRDYNRAVDRLTERDDYERISDHDPERAHTNDLLEALQEAVRERFGDIYRPSTPDLLGGTQMDANRVLGILEDSTAGWAITTSYTERADGVHVIAGAVNELNQHLSVGDSGGRGAEELTAAVGSVLTALGGLTRTR